MAFMMGCEKVHLDFPTKQVFDDLTVGVFDGDRIGIVGRNGDGKSTLLKLLARLQEPDDGRVLYSGNPQVGVLQQGDDLNPEDTVERAVVGDVPDYVWASDARIRNIIAGLISDVDWQAKVGELSGGQRRRVDLCRLLIGDWDVLMLDEPTNHLDVRSITWLADHLKQRWTEGAGALLVVTHDRWFLDEVCLRMWEVHDRNLTPFEGGFSAYIQQQVERDRVAAVTEARRRNAMRKELAWLSRGARARATKPKFHVDAARALIANDPPPRDPLELKRVAVQRLGKQVIDLNGVTEVLGGRTLLDRVDWAIGPGDRFGIVGANGAGKTTLLRLITKQLAPTSGYVKVGKTVHYAILSQRLSELEEVADYRVREVLKKCKTQYVVDGKEMSPGQLLEQLGFERQQLNTPVKDLSGGQKRRLQLLMVLLEEPNVLILDEPGNDMDTDMLAVMEDLLDAWPGTLVVVTHDRYLMERVTDDQFALMGGHIRHLPGGVDEYLKLEREARERENDAAGTPQGGVSVGEAGSATDSSTPTLSGAELHRLRKEVASLERKMETAETRLADAEQAMFDIDPTDYAALGDQQQVIAQLKTEKSTLEERWMEAAERLEGNA